MLLKHLLLPGYPAVKVEGFPDLLIADKEGNQRFDFQGRSFPWPKYEVNLSDEALL